jgi:hypothetical protein
MMSSELYFAHIVGHYLSTTLSHGLTDSPTPDLSHVATRVLQSRNQVTQR